MKKLILAGLCAIAFAGCQAPKSTHVGGPFWHVQGATDKQAWAHVLVLMREQKAATVTVVDDDGKNKLVRLRGPN